MLSDARLKELVALAEAATQGEWKVKAHASEFITDDLKIALSSFNQGDIPFIASANPATVKAMAQALLEARDLVEDLAGSLRDFGGTQEERRGSMYSRAADALDRADAMLETSQP